MEYLFRNIKISSNMTRKGTEVRLTQFSLQESKSKTWQFQVANNQLMEIAHT